jgi:hypothetical protein
MKALILFAVLFALLSLAGSGSRSVKIRKFLKGEK